MPSPVLDDFNRANAANLGTNWTQFPLGGTLSHRIVSNQAAGQSAGNQYAADRWNVATYGPDCDCFKTIAVNAADHEIYVRIQAGALNSGYSAYGPVAGTGWGLYKYVAGTPTLLGATFTITSFGNNSRIRLQAVGSVISFYHTPSGGGETLVATRTDSSSPILTAGYIGMTTQEAVGDTPRDDDFGGGTISSAIDTTTQYDARTTGGNIVQKARPASVISRGTWTDNAGSTVNADILAAVNEAVISDTTYIQSSQSPGTTADIIVLKFGSLNDPLSSSGHILRYRYLKDITLGDTVNLTVRIMQGVTEITNTSHSNIDAITQGSITLSGGQADSITDYTDLRVVFEVTSS